MKGTDFNTPQVRRKQGTAPDQEAEKSLVLHGGLQSLTHTRFRKMDEAFHSAGMNRLSTLWPKGTSVPSPYHTHCTPDTVLWISHRPVNIHNKPPDHTLLLSSLHRRQKEGTKKSVLRKKAGKLGTKLVGASTFSPQSWQLPHKGWTHTGMSRGQPETGAPKSSPPERAQSWETHVDLTGTPANLPEFFLPVLAVEQLRGGQSHSCTCQLTQPSQPYWGLQRLPKRLALQNRRLWDLMFSYSYHKVCAQCLWTQKNIGIKPIYEPKLSQRLTAASVSTSRPVFQGSHGVGSSCEALVGLWMQPDAPLT
jgi:hypothetical protein